MTVYAISEPAGSLVKIGHADDVRARFRGLMLGSPVPVVLRAHWAGGLRDEAALHDRFRDRRRHGEWFEFDDDDPVALITRALGRGALPALDTNSLKPRRAHRARPVAPELGVIAREDSGDGPYLFAGTWITPRPAPGPG